MWVLISLQAVLWLGSAWRLYSKSNMQSWVKYLYAITMFPLLEVLVTLNVILTGMIAPEILDLVSSMEANKWSGKVIAPVAFLAATPIAIIGFILWVKVLEYLDNKFA